MAHHEVGDGGRNAADEMVPRQVQIIQDPHAGDLHLYLGGQLVLTQVDEGQQLAFADGGGRHLICYSGNVVLQQLYGLAVRTIVRKTYSSRTAAVQPNQEHLHGVEELHFGNSRVGLKREATAICISGGALTLAGLNSGAPTDVHALAAAFDSSFLEVVKGNKACGLTTDGFAMFG